MTTRCVVIDGCALPVDLYNQARLQAIATLTTQCIGVVYDPPARPAAPTSMFELAVAILFPTLFADLRSGNHCRYLMGCSRDELDGCGCAMILYITPHAEEVAAWKTPFQVTRCLVFAFMLAAIQLHSMYRSIASGERCSSAIARMSQGEFR